MFDNDRRRMRLFQSLRSMRIGNLRRAIRGLVECCPEEIKVPDDLIRESPAREVEMALLEMEGRESRELEEALRWLASGRFGQCQDCGTRISPVRLRAVPFATRCRDCQEQVEQRSDRAERERWSPVSVRLVAQ
jgi:RNA polymerase-binding transcription factor